MTDVLLPVILCGGSGTRLWPLSRENHPKQFLALTGKQTMLQQTATRLRGLDAAIPQAAAPLLVCHEEYRFLAASQLVDAGVRQATILLEPQARNTAPALTIAALQARAGNADPVLLAMPADHAMVDLQAFHRAIEIAYEAACHGQVVTFGVTPDRPETGYGYIRYSPAARQGVHCVEGFVEKPDAMRARQYLDAGNYLWNSGLFMLRASVWLDALRQCAPDMLRACEAAMQAARYDLDFIRPDADWFARSPSDSIDYAVMEKLPERLDLGISSGVVPLRAGWSDIGSWDALWSISERNAEGNALVGDAVVQDGCTNSLLLSNSRLVVGIGLDSLIVAETPDAVLVMPKSRAQDVKQVVAHLLRSNPSIAHAHKRVHRPWGWYDYLDKGPRFQVKRIVIHPGASLSLQVHRHRAEHWVVVQGTAEVTNGDRVYMLESNQSVYIPLGQKHRLANRSEGLLEVIEVQTGDYLGEDDIVRFEDVYGRIDPNVH